VAIGVGRSKSLPERNVRRGRNKTRQIRRTAACVHRMDQYTQFMRDAVPNRQPV